METRTPDGRQVLWIKDDTARELYESLSEQPRYTVQELGADRPTAGALELSDVNDRSGGWLCLVMTDKVEAEVRSYFSDYACRLIIVEGAGQQPAN